MSSTTEPVTIESILGWFTEKIEAQEAIRPDLWIDAGAKLNVLLGHLIEDICERQQTVATLKFAYMNSAAKVNVSAAEAYIETTNEYRDLRKRELQLKQIEEYIRLAKLKARMLDSERRGN